MDHFPPLLLLAVAVHAPVTFAVPQAEFPDAPQPAIVLASGPGDAMAIHLHGEDYLTPFDLRAVTYVEGKRSITRAIALEPTRYALGGRWLSIRVAGEVEVGAYRIEGVRKGKTDFVLPLRLEVGERAPTRRGMGQVGLPWYTNRDAKVSVEALLRTPPHRMPRAFLIPLRDHPPLSLDSSTPREIPGTSELERATHGTSLKEPVRQPVWFSETIPDNRAHLGSEIEIRGSGLPANDCEVYLGDVELEITHETSLRVVAVAPPDAQTADLRMYWVSEDAWATVVDDYEVCDCPRPFRAFDADEVGVSWVNAYLTSLLAVKAYSSGSALKSAIEGYDLEFVAAFHANVTGTFGVTSGSVDGYVAASDEALFVVFEGSTNDGDWVATNAEFVPYAPSDFGNGVFVHQGFYEAMAAVHSDVLDAVEGSIGNRRLWIVGHSLGGAIAKLMAYRLEHVDGRSVAGVYTFGAPACGNAQWATRYDSVVGNTHRFNVEGDPVPSILPAIAFSHVKLTHNLFANGSHEFADDADFMYDLSTFDMGDIYDAHMSYWVRLYEELEQHEEDVFHKLPPPPGY